MRYIVVPAIGSIEMELGDESDRVSGNGKLDMKPDFGTLIRLPQQIWLYLRSSPITWFNADRLVACRFPRDDASLQHLADCGVTLLVNLHERSHRANRLDQFGIRQLHLPVPLHCPIAGAATRGRWGHRLYDRGRRVRRGALRRWSRPHWHLDRLLPGQSRHAGRCSNRARQDDATRFDRDSRAGGGRSHVCSRMDESCLGTVVRRRLSSERRYHARRAPLELIQNRGGP